MTTEYGIFSDEGFLEGDFYTKEAAEKCAADRYSEDDVHVAECCEQHREEEKEGCEKCEEEEPQSLCWTEGPCSCHPREEEPEEEE